MSPRGVCKAALVGAALLLIVGWMAVISVISVHHLKKDNIKLVDAIGLGRQKRGTSGGSSGGVDGATYIRWGRTKCPNDAELAYAGYAGGQHYTHVGGGVGYVCLSDKPVYASKTSSADGTASIYGVELELDVTNLFSTANAQPNALHDSDVQCAVCQSPRPVKIMIPGTNVCIDGWTLEYWGYLMTEHYNSKGRSEFTCVDNAPEAGKEGGARNDNGALMYHVQGTCGSLPCKPYVANYELTCVVCTK